MLFTACAGVLALAQTQPSSPEPPPLPPPVLQADVNAVIPPELRGRTVEEVRIVGNAQVGNAVIRNLIRTREGEPFSPEQVQEDYQRVYGLRRFSNVQARVEPLPTGGVAVIFVVDEQKLIQQIVFRGTGPISELEIRPIIDLEVGQSIDRFRIALARQAIQALYKSRNYPFAEVDIPQDQLNLQGILSFNIVPGPMVRVRKVDFIGNNSFEGGKIKDDAAIRTRHWLWIFRPGTYDPEVIEDDVARIRQFYEQRGFFDARVGRRVIFSPDMTEVQVTFVIEEGPRYFVDRVTFKGNASVSEVELREQLKLVEGQPWSDELLQRDIRQIVREYSPQGFIYEQVPQNRDYLHIEPKRVFRREPGKVELVYDISEGKTFRVGRVLVRGNSRTQDKVAIRELRVAPGQLYDSAELQDAIDRLRGTPYFQQVAITPIGDDPHVRDVLVEVVEARTASFQIGAGVNSNGGVGGNFTYEQRNFDIANPPGPADGFFSERAFVGAGQNLRISLEPGTEQTNASIRFSEPYLFDLPYSFTAEAYLRNRQREDYDERRTGGRLTFGKRFNYEWAAFVGFRGEDVEIGGIENRARRAPEILFYDGHSTVDGISLTVRRDTTNRGLLLYRGTVTSVGVEGVGLLGGDFDFQRYTATWDGYLTIYEDLLDRRTILAAHLDAGYITGDAPFFERFYGGGIGSVRGFGFRGISPRDGIDDDPIGGDFIATGSLELGFPLAGEILRGVVFTDAGTVEPDFNMSKIRLSAGAGVRITLPFFGQAPLALDFAWPIFREEEDDTQVISFSFGFSQ